MKKVNEIVNKSAKFLRFIFIAFSEKNSFFEKIF